MFKNTKERTRAVIYDTDNFRYVLDLPEDNSIATVPYVLRSISYATNVTWKQIAQFCGLQSASAAFVAAFRSRPVREMKYLNKYLVLDTSEKKIYFYHKDHKPAGVEEVHIGPELINPITEFTVMNKVPTKVLSRVSISAPDDAHLTLSLMPLGGYIFDEFDTRLAAPDMAHVVSGSARTLNKILRAVSFIATKSGTGEIMIKIDDGSGLVNGATSTAIRLTIKEIAEPSIPVLTLPEVGEGTINKQMDIPAISITDEDNKIMQMKVQPFGCSVTGFATQLTEVTPGTFHMSYGTPANIVADLSELKVTPYQKTCSLGFELKCDSIVIRKYLMITAAEPTTSTGTSGTDDHTESGSESGTHEDTGKDNPNTKPSDANLKESDTDPKESGDTEGTSTEDDPGTSSGSVTDDNTSETPAP